MSRINKNIKWSESPYNQSGRKNTCEQHIPVCPTVEQSRNTVSLGAELKEIPDERK